MNLLKIRKIRKKAMAKVHQKTIELSLRFPSFFLSVVYDGVWQREINRLMAHFSQSDVTCHSLSP